MEEFVYLLALMIFGISIYSLIAYVEKKDKRSSPFGNKSLNITFQDYIQHKLKYAKYLGCGIFIISALKLFYILIIKI